MSSLACCVPSTWRLIVWIMWIIWIDTSVVFKSAYLGVCAPWQVAEVVEAEERLEEEHRAAIQLERELLDEEDRLLQDINGVDYDVEDYAQRLDQILDAKIKKLTELSTSVRSFRKQLQDEEQASKQVPKGAMGDEF